MVGTWLTYGRATMDAMVASTSRVSNSCRQWASQRAARSWGMGPPVARPTGYEAASLVSSAAPRADVAIDKCNSGDTIGIRTLERVLKRAKIDLPPRS